MIKLIDILKEAKQVGILYHYTENWLLKQIIETNTLLAPVSFTRRQSNWVRDFTNGESIIVIDGNRLSNNYKIKPYQDINPFLADKPAERLQEFSAMLDRVHKADLKLVLDFVPNHLARAYHSDMKPSGVVDFGQNDNKDIHRTHWLLCR